MFILRSTDYSFTIAFLLVLRCYLSGRYGILRPVLSRQWRPRVQNWDPQPGRQRFGAGFRIILENPSRALAAQDVEGTHATHTVAARKIGDSSCDAQPAAVGTSLNIGMGFGAVWASGILP